MAEVVLKKAGTMNGTRPSSRRKTIGINGILQFCNGVVACLIFFGFFRAEVAGHPYMDWITLLLGLLLCFQTHIALRLEKRNPDPFVLIMAYLLTFFYALRIFTLLLYPVQDVFERYGYGPSDSNFALLYILITNTFLYAGFYRVKLRGTAEIETVAYRPITPRIGVALFVASLLFGLFVQKRIPEVIAPLINLIYNNFLTPNTILMVLVAYVVVFRKRLPSIYIKIVLGGAVILLVQQTLSFSRSGLLTFADNLLIVVLALLPTIRLPRRYVLVGFAMMPFLLATAFTFYSVSTTTRMVKGEAGGTLAEKVELIQASREILTDDPRTDFFIGQAFARAGYFDFSAEIIANSDRYAGVFTAGNYFKSIVDNVLSPGFDVFDQPKISNSIKYAMGDLGDFSKSQEIDSTYHTDMFGLYGEMYNLFGYASLPIIYFIAYLLKYAFRYKGKFNPRIIALNRILVLLVFFQWMNSFGLDWILMNILIAMVSFYGISKLFLVRLKSNGRNVSLSLGNARPAESHSSSQHG